MLYRRLLYLRNPGDYRRHFREAYCQEPVVTFDGVQVSFYEKHFGHAFFEGVSYGYPYRVVPKTSFSFERAERIDWMRQALLDDDAELYWGLDRLGGGYTLKRRVCIAGGEYVVVIEYHRPDEAEFVTAFPGSARTLRKLRHSPRWPGT